MILKNGDWVAGGLENENPSILLKMYPDFYTLRHKLGHISILFFESKIYIVFLIKRYCFAIACFLHVFGAELTCR